MMVSLLQCFNPVNTSEQQSFSYFVFHQNSRKAKQTENKNKVKANQRPTTKNQAQWHKCNGQEIKKQIQMPS